MKCERCELWLHDVLDGLEPDGALLEHLAACPACRELYESTVELTRELRRAPRPQLPEGMTDRIVAGVLFDRRRRQRRHVWTRVAAVAAALMFTVLTFEYWPRPTPPEGPTTVVVEKAESVRQVVVGAGSAVVDEAKRQVSEVVENALTKLPSLDLPPMDFESPLESAEKPLLEAGQGVTASLEPMADSAKRAFALFVRDLSPGTMKNKPGL